MASCTVAPSVVAAAAESEARRQAAYDSLRFALSQLASSWASIHRGASDCWKLRPAPESGLWVAGIDTGSMGLESTGASPAEAVLGLCHRVARELEDEAWVNSVLRRQLGDRRLADFCHLLTQVANAAKRASHG
jgi:hypothetical protein